MEQKSRRLIGGVARGRRVQMLVDGQPLTAFEGETIAAAFLAAGRRSFSHTAPSGAPRGVFCGIGVCFDCLVTVDGCQVRACVTPVEDGMQVSTTVP